MTPENDGLVPLNQTPPLRHLVHERLEGLIIDGTLPQGTKLREGELAATLGVSRGPMREALQILAQDGYVDLRPRQGAYVHSFTRREVDDVFNLRTILEGESARLAAIRATPKDHARLRGVIEHARYLLEQVEDAPAGSMWLGIHGEIAAIADNTMLSQILERLEKRFRWYLSPFGTSRARSAWEEHLAVIDAIVAGEPESARDLMVEHLEHARAAFYQRSADLLP